MHGTRIDLNNLSDIDTSHGPSISHNIKGTGMIPHESGMFDEPSFHEQPQQPQQPQQLYLPLQTESECVKNARHYETCPICSRLYNGTTYHNYAILLLLIVCIFLIKTLYSYQNIE